MELVGGSNPPGPIKYRKMKIGDIIECKHPECEVLFRKNGKRQVYCGPKCCKSDGYAKKKIEKEREKLLRMFGKVKSDG